MNAVLDFSVPEIEMVAISFSVLEAEMDVAVVDFSVLDVQMVALDFSVLVEITEEVDR